MQILNEYASRITPNDLMKVIKPWLELGPLVKGELKRNIININTALTWALGPTLSGADFNALMKKNYAKQKVIDGEVKKFMDKYPMGVGASTMLFMANPGLMILKGTREVSKKVSPENVEAFMKEYGFDDLAISRIPVGKMMTAVATRGAAAGSFATGTGSASVRGQMEGDDEAKWYTYLERLFLLQNPLKDRHAENTWLKGNLILEADEEEEKEREKESPDQGQAFLDVLGENGFMDKYYQQVAVPYIQIHEENIGGLMDLIEDDIADVALVAATSTMEEYVDALKKAQGEKFKSLNPDSIIPGVMKNIEEMLDPKKEKELTKILKVKKKKREDFENDEELTEYLVTVIFEKEYAPTRVTALQSLEQAVIDIQDEILGDLQEKDLPTLRETGPIGVQLANIMQDGLDRLNSALSKLASSSAANVETV
jgi:hypothetical protein